MTEQYPFKYMDESRKAALDFTAELNGAGILSATGTVVEGDVVLTQFAYKGTLCTFILSGGTPGFYRVLVVVQSSAGEIIECPVIGQVLSPVGA